MSKADTMRIALLSALIAVGGVAASAKTHGGGPAFEQIDANGDGQVTQDELRAHAAARFAEIDADNDGFVTPEEMRAARSERHEARGERQAARMLERYDADGNGELSAAELEKASEDRMGRRAGRMMDRMDANDDGKLSLDEMTARRDPARMFERLDTDNSGTLSAEEFAEARKHRGGRHGRDD